MLSLTGLLALGSAGAFAQSLDDPIGQVTSTVGQVVSTVEETADSATGGATGGVTGGTSPGSGGTSPSTGGATSPVTGDTSSSGTKTKKQKESERSERGFTIAATCAEASRDPRAFAAWKATFKEGQGAAAAGAGDARKEKKRDREAQPFTGGVGGAEAESPAPRVPGAPLPDEDEIVFPSWLAWVALTALALGFAVLLGVGARALLAGRGTASTVPPSSAGGVRRSI